MNIDVKYVKFFRNWWEMAEGRDTDEKRLAFYDTIFRYAFENIVPEKPVKGVSDGKSWAAWDAYCAVSPIIDTIIDCIEKHSKAAEARWGKKRRAESVDRVEDDEKHLDGDVRAEPALMEQDAPVSDAPPTTLDALKRSAKAKGIPASFAEEFFEELKATDWMVRSRGTQASSLVRVTGRSAAAIMGERWNWRKKHPDESESEASEESRRAAVDRKVKAEAKRLREEMGI